MSEKQTIKSWISYSMPQTQYVPGFLTDGGADYGAGTAANSGAGAPERAEATTRTGSGETPKEMNEFSIYNEEKNNVKFVLELLGANIYLKSNNAKNLYNDILGNLEFFGLFTKEDVIIAHDAFIKHMKKFEDIGRTQKYFEKIRQKVGNAHILADAEEEELKKFEIADVQSLKIRFEQFEKDYNEATDASRTKLDAAGQSMTKNLNILKKTYIDSRNRLHVTTHNVERKVINAITKEIIEDIHIMRELYDISRKKATEEETTTEEILDREIINIIVYGLIHEKCCKYDGCINIISEIYGDTVEKIRHFFRIASNAFFEMRNVKYFRKAYEKKLFENIEERLCLVEHTGPEYAFYAYKFGIDVNNILGYELDSGSESDYDKDRPDFDYDDIEELDREQQKILRASRFVERLKFEARKMRRKTLKNKSKNIVLMDKETIDWFIALTGKNVEQSLTIMREFGYEISINLIEHFLNSDQTGGFKKRLSKKRYSKKKISSKQKKTSKRKSKRHSRKNLQ